MGWERIVARWRASIRFQDKATALGTFALGLALNLLGLTHMYSEFGIVDGVAGWAPTALLAMGCGVMLFKRRHPMIALCSGVPIAIVDALLGGGDRQDPRLPGARQTRPHLPGPGCDHRQGGGSGLISTA